MSLFDFLKWCFQDRDHGFWTFIAVWMAFDGLAKVVRAARGVAE